MTNENSAMTELSRAVHELQAENDRLRCRVDELVARVERDDQPTRTSPPGATGDRTSRRDLLKLAGAGAAGAVGATLLAASPAGATVGTMQYGTTNNAASDPTDLSSSARTYVLGLHALDTTTNASGLRVDGGTTANPIFDGIDAIVTARGDAVFASNSGTGGAVLGQVGPTSTNAAIAGLAFNTEGVYGSSFHGPGVTGEDGGTGSGPGVVGKIVNASNSSTAMQASTAGTGSALSAEITNGANSSPALFVLTEGTGYGLWAQQTGGDVAAVYGDCSISGGPGVLGVAAGFGVAGVHGQSQEGPGVLGESLQSDNTSPAVSGTTFGKGNAVSGQISNPSSSANAVYGVTNGTGAGVYGQITNSASTFPAVTGVTNGAGAAVGGVATGSGAALAGLVLGGTGTGIQASIINPANSQPGLSASTNGTGPAIQGQATGTGIGLNASSTNGRGAVLAGGAAQARLVPSGSSSHPSSGQVGDLFVDSSARLWFCVVTGSPATWKQVQVA